MSRDACADKTIVSSYAPANVQIKTGVRSERFIGLYGAISGWQHRGTRTRSTFKIWQYKTAVMDDNLIQCLQVRVQT